MSKKIAFKESTNGLSDQKRRTTAQHSEMLQDLISSNPGLLIRWGNLLFLMILLLLAFGCWFIKYPDTIQATAKLTSINAPKPVVNFIEGKLIKLKAIEDQFVTKGEILGFMESNANHEEVLKLSSHLDSIHVILSNDKPDQIKKYLLGKTSLGELQTDYQTFLQSFLSYENYLLDGFFLKKKAMLVKDRNNLLSLYENLNEQKKLQEQDLSLIQKTFDANESLKKNSIISDFDYRNEQSKLINKKLTLPQIRSAIIGNESQQIEKEREIIEIDNNIIQQKLIFEQSLNTFKSRVEEWKKKYILTAPISGKIAFSSFIEENQQLQMNQTLCFVNPEDSQYFAEVIIPQSNFGKVEVGQKVLLRFHSYPFQEHGSVAGKIEFISHIPGDDGYSAKVGFTHGLTTTYNKKLHYRTGLLADAEIITKDMRLLERFYYNIVRQVRS